MRLYARLIHLWPHHERKQVEDFLTECFAESLRHDNILVQRVLSCIAPDREWPEVMHGNYSVQTQEWYSGRRFDMHLRLEGGINLVFEYKVDAPLGMYATEGTINAIDQIDEYCRIIPDNWLVAHIGNHAIEKRVQPKFIGSTTWNQVAKQLQMSRRNTLNDGLLTLFEELNMTDLNLEDLYSANRGYRFREKIKDMLINAGKNIGYPDSYCFNRESISKADSNWVGYSHLGINHPIYCWQGVYVDSRRIKELFDWDDSIPVLAAGLSCDKQKPIVSLIETDEFQTTLNRIGDHFNTIYGEGSNLRLSKIMPTGYTLIMVSTSLLDLFSSWNNQDEYLRHFIQRWVDFLDLSGILRFLT